MNISPFHRPESSNRFLSLFVSLMKPPMALYVPPTQPLVLNSISAIRWDSGHLTVLWSPSSYFILPKRIPLAYMFGCVMKLSRGNQISLLPYSSLLELELTIFPHGSKIS